MHRFVRVASLVAILALSVALLPGVLAPLHVAQADTTPTIALNAPAAGQLVYAGATVPLSVTITNFTLAPQSVGMAAVAGQGHYHIFLDGQYIGNSAYVTGTAIIPVTTMPGMHTLSVSLANNDHSLITPTVSAQTMIVVMAEPQIQLLSPAANATVTAGTVQGYVSVSNFLLDPFAVGYNAVPGTGHYHIFLDGKYIGNSAGTGFVANLSGASVGQHLLTVNLANNDHSLISLPTASASVTLTVQAGQ